MLLAGRVPDDACWHPAHEAGSEPECADADGIRVLRHGVSFVRAASDSRQYGRWGSACEVMQRVVDSPDGEHGPLQIMRGDPVAGPLSAIPCRF